MKLTVDPEASLLIAIEEAIVVGGGADDGIKKEYRRAREREREEWRERASIGQELVRLCPAKSRVDTRNKKKVENGQNRAIANPSPGRSR
jgi:hypothetical protein